MAMSRTVTVLVLLAAILVVAMGCGRKATVAPASGPPSATQGSPLPAAGQQPSGGQPSAATVAKPSPPASAIAPAPSGKPPKPKLTDAQYIKLIGEIGAVAARNRDPRAQVNAIVRKYGLSQGDLQNEHRAHLEGKSKAERDAYTKQLVDALLAEADKKTPAKHSR
jgi:hypothetical protein